MDYEQNNLYLDTPTIKHNITEVSYGDIYRVYKEDPCYCIMSTKTVSNWGGRIYDEIVRTKFDVGDTLRTVVCTYKQPSDTDNIQDANYFRSLYFTIMHKFNEYKFLGRLIRNTQMDEYEDAIIIGDVHLNVG